MILNLFLYIYMCISLSSSQNGFLTTNQLEMLDRGNHSNVHSKLEFPFGRILGRPRGGTHHNIFFFGWSPLGNDGKALCKSQLQVVHHDLLTID